MVFEEFSYIYRPTNRKYSEKDVLEVNYNTIDLLENKFLVYGKKYRLYNSYVDFFEDLELMPESERIYHEVILDLPQKIKFDIDAKYDSINLFEIPNIEDVEMQKYIDLISRAKTPHEICRIKYKHIINYIYEMIKITFFIEFSKELKDSDIIICESKDETEKKFSNHMIINNYYFENNEQSKEFTKKIYNKLPLTYKEYLDVSVNKRVQNFRLIYNHKIDSTRTKKLITKHNFADTLISNIANCKKLPNIYKVTKVNEEVTSSTIAKIIEVCKNANITDHVYKGNKGGLMIFKRIHASYCDFCNRTHHSDNTLFVTSLDKDGVVKVFKQCRKYIAENTENKTELIGEFVSDKTNAKSASIPANSWVDLKINKSIDVAGDNYFHNVFKDLPRKNKNIYCEKTIKPFEFTPTLVVHAMMKMGKTKALKDYINNYFHNEIKNPVIRILSFRQTFSSNIKDKFPDFVLYSDVKGSLYQKKLIIQVESLHRLNIEIGSEPADLVILDECESIFEQFGSGLLKNTSECFSKFQWLLKYSKNVICMDANISNRTFNILGKLRGDFLQTDKVIYHCNEYKNATEDQYYATGNKMKWLSILYASIESGERLGCPMSSLSEAKILYKTLMDKYPDKRIKLYSSETKYSEKKEHFENVDYYWAEFDILIYTPTISAGISFEKVHYNKIFGYFTDQSCSIETCTQMIGRIRNVSDKKFFMCFNATGNNLPVEIDEIKNHIYTKRDNLLKNFDDSGLVAQYGPYGEIKYNESDYFHVWLENTKMRNLSKNYFIERFIKNVMHTGAQFEYLTDSILESYTGIEEDDLRDELMKIEDLHLSNKKFIKHEKKENIANAEDLDQDEIENIKDAIILQEDISDGDLYSYQKYKLQKDYNFDGVVDEVFVEKYFEPKIRRNYKNISRISICETVEKSLQVIKSEELNNYNRIMDMDDDQHYLDINRKFVYDQHRYTIGLVKLCGYDGIYDTKFIHMNTILRNLETDTYWNVIRSACIEFDVKTPIRRYVLIEKNEMEKIKLLIKPINKILDIMYGAMISAKKNDPSTFRIIIPRLFSFNENEAKEKNIPYINKN